MKIALSTENTALLNSFVRTFKESGVQLINAKLETILFETIENAEADAYVISSNMLFSKKAIDFIKKFNPYIPVILLETHIDAEAIPSNVDVVLPEVIGNETLLSKMIYHSIYMYKKNFETLHKLTAKMHDKIEFANCIYDPTRRILYRKVTKTLEDGSITTETKQLQKLSQKSGGILEILAINFGEVVKREVILEKVWRKTDYFVGRSMDVYVTGIRNIFKENKIKLNIKNISGIGLILE